MNKAKAASAKTSKANHQRRRRNGVNGAHADDAKNGESAVVRAVRADRVVRADRADRKALQSAIRRYADLYEFAPVGYVTFDRAGRIEDINLAACELLRSKREFLIGSPFSLYVAPKDLTVFLGHLVHCRAGERRVETSLHLKRHTGEIALVILSSTPTTNLLRDGAHVYQTAIVDLTERERADQQLRQAAQFDEAVMTNMGEGLYTVDAEGSVTSMNPAAEKFFGWSFEELRGKKMHDVTHYKHRDGSPFPTKECSGLQVLRKGTAIANYEDVFIRKDGTFFDVIYSSSPIRVGGKITGLVVVFRDVTEQKRTEAAVMRLAAIVQSSADAVVAKNLDGTITDWNASAERIFGYKAKEIIGKSILTLIPKERHPEETEIIRKIRKGESIDHYQTVRRRKDGRLIEVSLTISPIKDFNGKIVGVSKVARDITKQKKAERRLAEQARLLDLSNEAILVRDHEDRILYWNHGAQEIYGYKPEEALGKVTQKLLRTKHSQGLEEIYKTLERENRWSGELVHCRKDGSKVVVMSHWALDRDPSGKSAFILESNSDITARKNAEVALQRSKTMLEKLVLHRTRALRVANTELESEIRRRKGLEGQILEISDREQEKLGQELHDGLCQQLTAIGFLTRATALRLKHHRVVQVDELEKITQLINGSVMDARNIARDLHKEEIAAAEFVAALRDLVQRKIWQTSCRLELKTSLEIENDTVASQLYRVLREAILNANKHAHAKEIVLQAKRAKNDYVFTVTDNGVGFKSKTRGEGLGFHIMKYRADSIGARLEVESLKKGGTRVTCSLPIEMTK